MRSFRVGGAVSHNMGRYGHGRSYGVRRVKIRNHRTQILRGDSVRRRDGDETFSPNGVHRGGRPAAVRAVYTFVHRISARQSKPNLLQ